LAATRALPGAAGDDRRFYAGKLAACAWFFRWELPKTAHWADLVESLDPISSTVDPDSL
ncbi:MAG: acyl-CoA dehydrogenase C-terminal domain-containing protein, partial [Alphaproteobacteria bacterium]